MSMPVPGHIIHSRMLAARRGASAMMPRRHEQELCGAMIHAIIAPIAMLMLMRLPTIMPEPMREEADREAGARGRGGEAEHRREHDLGQESA